MVLTLGAPQQELFYQGKQQGQHESGDLNGDVNVQIQEM